MNDEIVNGTVLNGAEHGLNQPPPPSLSLRLTHHQLATILVLEAQIQQLQIAANQLGGFLKLKEEADILISARDYIEKAKVKLQKGWERSIVVANEMPRILK